MANARRPGSGRRGLDHDEIDADRQVRQWTAVGQFPAVEEYRDGLPESRSLGGAERLFRQPEVAPAPPANLDEHELARRAGIDGDDVELTATGPDIPGEHEPAFAHESPGHQALRRIADLSGRRRHERRMESSPARALT
jgi:hypothetical protein